MLMLMRHLSLLVQTGHGIAGSDLPSAALPAITIAIAVFVGLLITNAASPTPPESAAPSAYKEFTVVVTIRWLLLLKIKTASPATTMPPCSSAGKLSAGSIRRRGSRIGRSGIRWGGAGTGRGGSRGGNVVARRSGRCRGHRRGRGRRRSRARSSGSLATARRLQRIDGGGVQHAGCRELLLFLELGNGVASCLPHDPVLRHPCSDRLRQARLRP